jgi:polygalacturonase
MRLLQFSTYSAALLGCSLAVAAVPSFNVRDFGARGDGAAKDIVSGAVHLKSNVTLYLSPGSVLLASPDNADFHPYQTLPFQSVSDRKTTYFHYALVAAENVHDIAIVGEGVIDGNRSKRGGPKTVAIKLCERVTIRGITVRNATNYAISF